MSNSTLSKETKPLSARNQSIDLMKLILSFFVVIIHSEANVGPFTPFLRTAVPLFFVVSSYYFFKKIKDEYTTKQCLPILFKFLKRNLQLYAFWFILLSPLTFLTRDWFSDGIFSGILNFLQALFFGSTFKASWYIMALNIGMCIIFFISRKIRPAVLLILTLPFFVICAFVTNYYGLIQNNVTIVNAIEGYKTVFHSIANGFPASLFWIALGNLFAKKEPKANMKKLVPVLLGFSLVLVAEEFVISHFGTRINNANDVYFSLILFCPLAFIVIKNLNIKLSKDFKMGNVSTIIYTSHGAVITIFGAVLKRIIPLGQVAHRWIVFIVSLSVCLFISFVIFKLEKKKGFSWLKYSH